MIANLLARQIDSPVRWVESVRKMIGEGVEVIIEVGYGSVLQGLIRKTAGKEWHGEILGCASEADIPAVLAAVG